MKDGCENCPEYDYSDLESDHTTTNFTGMIAMILQRDSWVAKWNQIGANRIPGIYAIAVNDELTLASDRKREDEIEDGEDMEEGDEVTMSTKNPQRPLVKSLKQELTEHSSRLIK